MKTASPGTPGKLTPMRRTLLALAAIVLAIVVTLPLATRLEPIVGDMLAYAAYPEDLTTRDDIVIVTITEETLAGFPYRSPIDRGLLAELIEKLDAAGARAIGLDILVDGPSEPEKDLRLREALNKAQTPVILANLDQDAQLTEAQRSYLASFLDSRRSASIVLSRDETDAILRHLPRRPSNSPGALPGFAEAIAETAMETEPTSGRILYRLSDTSEQTAFPRYPAHMVRLLPDSWFTDKFVLIGTDLAHEDQHPTPLTSFLGTEAGTLPGIAVHAHILNQILAGRSLPTLPFDATLALIAAAAVGAVTAFQFVSRPGLFFGVLGVSIVAYLVLAWVSLTTGTMLLPVLAPPTAATAAALFLALFRWQEDRSQRQFLKTAFSRYVSPSVVNRLSNGDLRLALGGEKRRVTYIFTDLEGFTGLSEGLAPDKVAEILNRYLDGMCDLMSSHGATIDKIIGDAVVGFFGAPDENPTQASAAIRLALKMDRYCEAFRAECRSMGVDLGVTRIGIHTGDAVIGNFGGSRFFDYTGIGDTVNTAARLEGANRYLGTRICASCETVDACSEETGADMFRPLGALVLKGRSSPLECFEPLPEDRVCLSAMNAYRKAFDLLKAGDPLALQAMEAAERLAPEDGPTILHLRRLRQGETGTTVTLTGK